jgi:hypothetical protein
MVVCPAVVGGNVIPVGDLLELINKPLLLKLFALKDNPRLYKTAMGGHGFDEAGPSTGLGAFKEGLSL